MKKLDKIFYHKGDLRTPFAMSHRTDDADIEYIRKDALIKFLEKKKKGKEDVLLSVNSFISFLNTI